MQYREHRFNSTLVQLKAGRTFLTIKYSRQFQFYLSSIKSSPPRSHSADIFKFQFYLSSIKSPIYFNQPIPDSSFNSTLVQLKDSESGPPAYYRKRFNSTLVQLKEAAFILAFLFLVMFQFDLSSIKRLIQCHGSRTPSSFNSTLVQLKV